MRFDSRKNLYVEANGVNLSEEHLFPPTKDPHKAWEIADMSLKVTQNLNRTHPMRADFYDSKETKKRIKQRRNKNIGEYIDDFDFNI